MGAWPAAACGARLCQRVRRGAVALTQIALLVAAPLRVRLLAPREVLAVQDAVQQILLLLREGVLVGRRLAVGERAKAAELIEQVIRATVQLALQAEAAAVRSAGIIAVALAQLVRRLIGEKPLLRGRCVVVVLLQTQHAQPELRILLRQIEVVLRELPHQARLIRRFYEVVVGVCHRLIPPLCGF